MEHFFDSFCKQLGRQAGRRQILSLVFKTTGTALLARMGLLPAYAQTSCLGAPCAPANSSCCNSAATCYVDGLCGFPLGTGPCTHSNASLVCRSGACNSITGLCAALGGCGTDIDCAAGFWCNESAQTCTPLLSNGTPIPSDPPHQNPALNGVCTATAGALVCATGVCDAGDNKCGLANGDGPCTPTNSGVCRSGKCSATGRCEPVSGCLADADCAAGFWCNESAQTCIARLPNGTPVPSDPPHQAPALNGVCTAAAGTLVCASGVCDASDNKCGFANGDGPCTAATGPTVCRSGSCSTAGVCAPSGGCAVSADCPPGQGCCSGTCTSLGTNQNCAACGNICSTPYTCIAAPNNACLKNNSAGVQIHTSGWLFSRVTQQFSGTLTVTNTSGSPIGAPVVVALNGLTSGVMLANSSGTLSGAPLASVQSAGTLAAGASVNATLNFQNPMKTAIVFTPVAYTG